MDISEIQKNSRKNKDFLATAGYGVVVFVLWAVIKVIVYAFYILPTIIPNFDYASKIGWIVSYTSVYAGADILYLITGFLSTKIGKKDAKCCLIVQILSIPTFLFALIFIIDDVYSQILLGGFDFVLLITILMDGFFAFLCAIILFSSFKLSKNEHFIKRYSNER